ncbi:MAG: hypothetical protein KA788_12585 [Lacunisphaera sp.]|nr:hypothetical protein [Lacunisphaera sp.]
MTEQPQHKTSRWRSWLHRLRAWRQSRRALKAGRNAYAARMVYHNVFSLPEPGWKPKTKQEALEHLRALRAVREDCDKAAAAAMKKEIARG